MDLKMSEWLTYYQLAEKYNVSPESIRQRCLRGNWRRQSNNEGKTICLVPDDLVLQPRKRKIRSNNTAVEQPIKTPASKDLERIIAVLENHLVSVQRELALVNQQLAEEKLASAELLITCKEFAAELTQLKSNSSSNQVKNLQQKIAESLPVDEPIKDMSSILKRLQVLKLKATAA